MSRIKVISGVIILVLLGAVIFLARQGGEERALARDPVLKPFYEAAVAAEARISDAPESPAGYLDAGIKWKTIGDQTNDQQWYKKALEIYERGIAVVPKKNSILLFNAGQMSEFIGDFTKAELYYTQTIEAEPGEPQNYLALIDFYRYKMKKSPEEILAVYTEALKRVVFTWDLMSHRAAYYKVLGKFAEALADYETLYKARPDAIGIANEIAELKALLHK